MSTTDDSATANEDSTSTDAVECPVDGCEYEGPMESVAAHFLGTPEDRHSLDDVRFARDGDRGSDSGTGGRSASETPAELPDDLDLSFLRDALSLLELLEEYDADSFDELDEVELTDLYVLLAALRGSADDARKAVRDELHDRLDADQDVDAGFGTVSRYSYEATDLADEDRVRERLERAGVDPDAVTSLDSEKVEKAVEETDLRREDVFDLEEVERLRVTDTEDDDREGSVSGLDADLRRLLERR